MTTAQHAGTHRQATIEAVPDMPVITITRDFHAKLDDLLAEVR